MKADRLAVNARPVDRVAARVTAGGTHWDVSRKPACIETFEAPPVSEPMPEGVRDIAGWRRGRLVAFRYHDSGGRWLCRCDCGRYEVRHGHRWVKKTDPDACHICRAAYFAKHGYAITDTRTRSERERDRRARPSLGHVNKSE